MINLFSLQCRNILLCFSLLQPLLLVSAQGRIEAKIDVGKVITYKTVKTKKGEFPLKLHVFSEDKLKKKNRTCVVMFHSGGWSSGSPERYFSHARKYSKKGWVGISVEYRIKSKHGGSPLDSVRDAKSAMRWVRSHAKELGIDPDKIIVKGSSAGGHLAAACATVTSFNEKKEDTKVSCVPNVLILSSPVLDNGPGGYGYNKSEVRKNWQKFSPFHNVKKGIPPMFISIGDNEAKYIRVSVAQELKKKIEKLGQKCELVILKGAKHGKRSGADHKKVAKEEEVFLKSLGYSTR